MDDAHHLWRVKRRKQANRRRRWRSVFKDVVGVPRPVSPTSGYRTLESNTALMILRAFQNFRGQSATFSSPADRPLAMFSKPWFTKQIELAGP
jgi:hypothetical protein